MSSINQTAQPVSTFDTLKRAIYGRIGRRMRQKYPMLSATVFINCNDLADNLYMNGSDTGHQGHTFAIINVDVTTIRLQLFHFMTPMSDPADWAHAVMVPLDDPKLFRAIYRHLDATMRPFVENVKFLGRNGEPLCR
jgi:hypothetical protein